jgi:hypothetical protein
MTIDNELIDNLLKDYKKPADLIELHIGSDREMAM